MRVEDPTETKERIAESRRAVEAAESSIEERELVFNWVMPDGATPWEAKFIQAELGMYPSQEFVTRITEILESFTEGEMGMKIGELFRGDIELPEDFTPDTVNKVVEDNVALVQAFFKLVKIVPDLELDIMCLSLGVPRTQWKHAKEQMKEPPHRGGLTVTEGFDILIWFIKQNGELLTDTLRGKAQELVDVFRLHVLKEEPTEEETETKETPALDAMMDLASPGGTPSNTSSQPTPASD